MSVDSQSDTVTLKDDIMELMNPCEPYAAADISGELDEPRRTVDYNLRKLHEEGRINRKQHSKRRVTWWIDR